MYDFLWRALIAGLGFSITAGCLGSFVVWRRMAYFGDTLAHAGLLGVALGFALHSTMPLFGVVAVCLAIALLLLLIEHRTKLSHDSILGILSHTALALGILVVAALPRFRSDLFGYLFGDILAVGWQDIAMIFGLGTVVMALVLYNWNKLVAMTVHEELAAVEGVSLPRQKMLFVISLALTIAIAMKILGVLLITAMLIIPPAAARPFAKTPEQMVFLAMGLGMLSVCSGLGASLWFDLPAGPAIVVAAATLFAVTQMKRV